MIVRKAEQKIAELLRSVAGEDARTEAVFCFAHAASIRRIKSFPKRMQRRWTR